MRDYEFLTLVEGAVGCVARLGLQPDVAGGQDESECRQDDGVQAADDGQQVGPPQAALPQLVAARRGATGAPDLSGVPAGGIRHNTHHQTHRCNKPRRR